MKRIINKNKYKFIVSLGLMMVFFIADARIHDVKAETLNNPQILKDASMDSGQKVTWDCIYFGNYPQTEIVDKPTTSGCYGKSWEKKGDYEVDAATYAKLKNITGWDSNGDATVDGKKYRRIKGSDTAYRTFGVDGWYDWTDVSKYHYFRYDKIKWRVLKVNNNEAFLLTDKILDDKYNINHKDVTWEKSTMRSWLNGYGASENNERENYSEKNFIKSAFSSAEKSAIRKTNVINYNSLNYGTEGGNNTQDQIFLLSESEVYTNAARSYGFISDPDVHDNGRRSKSSTYAKAMGTWIADTNSIWWLRSPSSSPIDAVSVDCRGRVYDGGIDELGDIKGVRPALNLNLSLANLWTYAGTVSSNGEENNKSSSDEQPSIPDKQPSIPDKEPVNKPQKTNNKIYAESKIITYGSKAFYLNAKTKGKVALSYTSSDKKVAVIDKKGKITLKGYGKATISIYARETTQYTKVSKNITITVIPKKMTLKKVTSPKKNFVKVEWGKDKTVTGYQMMFSRTKNFKNSTYIRWYKQKQNSMYGFGLERKKIYYFKIRAYKTVGKKRFYGTWSTIKKVKIK